MPTSSQVKSGADSFEGLPSTELFCAIDTNHDGLISSEELSLYCLTQGMEAELVSVLFQSIDVNSDGMTDALNPRTRSSYQDMALQVPSASRSGSRKFYKGESWDLETGPLESL